MMMSFSRGPDGEPRRRDSGERRRFRDSWLWRLGQGAIAIAAIASLTTATLSWLGWTRFDARAEIDKHEHSVQMRDHRTDSTIRILEQRIKAVEDTQDELKELQRVQVRISCLDRFLSARDKQLAGLLDKNGFCIQ